MSHDARAAFSRATELHRQGKLDDAIEIYRRLNRSQPAFEVQRLLVFALLQAGRSKEALAAARRARESYPGEADAFVLLGAALQANRALEEALAAYEAAAQRAPDLGEAHYLAGKLLSLLGRQGEAIVRFDRVLALDSRATEALAYRAAALLHVGAQARALADYETLTAMQPWHPEHRLGLAEVLLRAGRFADAVAQADEALRSPSVAAEAHLFRGRGLLGLGQCAAARSAFEAAVALAPGELAWRADLSRLARVEGAPREALSICNAAIALDPHCVPLLAERAEARRDLGDGNGALADARAAIALDPGFAPAQVTLAMLEADFGRRPQADAALAAAMAADPSDPQVRYLAAAEHLAHGRWSAGWADYESRVALVPPSFRPLGFARWDGVEPVDELIVLGEQGLGDHLMFGRLLRLLVDRGLRVRWLVASRHVVLLRRIDARVSVVSDLDGLDLAAPGLRWVPMGSLPGLIAPDPATWPKPPYLTADPERVARWRTLGCDPAPPPAETEGDGPAEAPEPVPEPARFRIGICWQGNPSPLVDVGRSVPLAAFAPLARMEGVELVCLQWGPGLEQLAQVPFADRVLRLPEGRDADGSFVDTAGVLQHLDLVITCDTSMSHLAGARGRPTFVLLRAVPEWRWGLGDAHTVFYPHLRLFPQQRAGDWSEVFTRVVAATRPLVAAKEG